MIPVVLWEDQAKEAASKLSKGSEVLVQGYLRQRKYNDQNIVEVVGTSFDLLGKGGETAQNNGEEEVPF